VTSQNVTGDYSLWLSYTAAVFIPHLGVSVCLFDNVDWSITRCLDYALDCTNDHNSVCGHSNPAYIGLLFEHKYVRLFILLYCNCDLYAAFTPEYMSPGYKLYPLVSTCVPLSPSIHVSRIGDKIVVNAPLQHGNDIHLYPDTSFSSGILVSGYTCVQWRI